MLLTRRILTATKRNTVNLLTAAQADVPSTANGWGILSTATSVASATPGPFGFGTGALFTAAAAGGKTLTLAGFTVAQGGNKFSIFVRPGTESTLTLSFVDTTNTLTHSCNFVLTAGVWTVGTMTLGLASARVQPYVYDNSWVRLEIELIPGNVGAGATAVGNAISIQVAVATNAKTVELACAMLEAAAATDFVSTVAAGNQQTFSIPLGISKGSYNTGTDMAVAENYDLLVTNQNVFVSQGATFPGGYTLDPRTNTIRFDAAITNGNTVVASRRGSFASPYMVGMQTGLQQDLTVLPNVQKSYNGLRDLRNQELPLWRPNGNTQVSENDTGNYTIQGLSTPVFSVVIEGRRDPTAPWQTAVAITDAALVAGVAAGSLPLFPEMRFRWVSIGNTTTTLDLWVTE